MTQFEIISIILLWIILGTWISYKRNWYKGVGFVNGGKEFFIVLNILFAPFAFIITLLLRLFHEPWEQN